MKSFGAWTDISGCCCGIQHRITINFHNSWLSHVTRWNFDEATLKSSSSSSSENLLVPPGATLYHSPQIETYVLELHHGQQRDDDDDGAALILVAWW
jgi:hypothetical protein